MQRQKVSSTRSSSHRHRCALGRRHSDWRASVRLAVAVRRSDRERLGTVRLSGDLHRAVRGAFSLVFRPACIAAARSDLADVEPRPCALGRTYLRREKPTELTVGPASVYCFGSDDPTALLGEAMEAVSRQFKGRVGEPVESKRPLRFFVFGKRAAFEDFVKRSLLNPGDLDGLYIPWSTRTIALTTETPENRLSDLPRVVRTLVSYFFLD